MPPMIQCELAREQFIQGLTPDKLCLHVQLDHPRTLVDAFKLAMDRGTIACVSWQNAPSSVPVALAAGMTEQRPAWVDKLECAVRI